MRCGGAAAPIFSASYNGSLHTLAQSVDVVLVAPRNPLNIGAAARAMANFGFAHLTVAAPYAPHWREAKSAVGAPQVLADARETGTLAEAVAQCTFIAGTGTLVHRRPEQEVLQLPALAPRMLNAIAKGGRAALVFGPEKHGLTRDDLSYCHVLVEIPTDPRQPSMNMGQAVAVCLYELCRSADTLSRPNDIQSIGDAGHRLVDSAALERLGELIEETLSAADYSPEVMRNANRHDLRLLLRRLNLSAQDTRRILGIFRRILWRLHRGAP
ncbi:MAG: RNA methyltransferase [Acidobacteriota bacterium]